MFELGDKVRLVVDGKAGDIGEVVLWYYDEGNVWVVDFGAFEMLCNDVMIKAI
jgi:hypothetical protein